MLGGGVGGVPGVSSVWLVVDKPRGVWIVLGYLGLLWSDIPGYVMQELSCSSHPP